jgi:putative nucleotidyltransferase with HDIG domain
MTKKIKKSTRDLFNALHEIGRDLGTDIFVVGGFVRDLKLGFESKDIDFVVLDDALKLARMVKKRLHANALVVYPNFGTAMIQLDRYKLEFVTARKESYAKSSRKPVVQKADLAADLSRRDFTVNAMAMDIGPENFGTIIDPWSGISDLEKKILRTPLDPELTFSDDPLRMMRAVRFATRLSFKIEEQTLAAIRRKADRLEIVSQERITDEFNKIMMAPKPSAGLNLLFETDLLNIFLPEFVLTRGTEQRSNYHHKDVFYHTLQVIDKLADVSDKLELRLAALFHDIAKPRTKRFEPGVGWTFHGHEVVGERMTGAILRRLKYPTHTINYVKKLVRQHLRPMFLVDEEVTDSAIRRLLFLAGEEFDDLMTLCRADITSKNPRTVKQHMKNYEIVMEKARIVEEKDRMRAFKSPVDGIEIMQLFDLKPGPEIGRIKKFVEEAILDGEIPNEHDAARAFLLENKSKFIDP